jgi:hypothetical protein
MQYSELKLAITDLVNRSDLTTTKIDRYVKMTLDRINRQLRASFMETEATLTIGSESDADVPADYLATVSMYDDASSAVYDPFVYKGFFDFKTIDPNDNGTKYYTRRNNKFYFKPSLAAASTVKLSYHAKVAYPTGDTYEPELFKIAADLVIYGAVAHACAAFIDERTADFNEAFAALLEEVKEHYASSSMSEGPYAIEPATNQEY